MKNVAILTYNHAALFELGCAIELFALPRPEFSQWYCSEVVSFDAGPHTATGGLLMSSKQIDSLRGYDGLVIPSWPTDITQVRGLLADEIRQFQRDGKRILSFCSGAFLLAALGLLNGRRATTHWRYASKFRQRFPAINYVEDVLYTFEGQLGCSAGSTAAIDLGLEVIRGDFGNRVADQVARRLVMSAHRKGGQSQFVESPITTPPTPFDAALNWAMQNLQTPFTVTTLARIAGMSRRTFDRKFSCLLKQTPKQWIILQKLNIAKQMLAQVTCSIEQIADRSGFDNAASMRHHFRKLLGVSPRQYRDQFAAT